ncbi:MAG: hypothetical protein JOZ45_00535 [Acidobacteriaceae bacterium]|nr:hypothetical protein [Acidobacteriaceae bacterium]
MRGFRFRHCFRDARLWLPRRHGTLAHAVKDGIPQFVVPHAHGQPDHALRVERLGLGRSLYPEKDRCRAATILKELLESAMIRQRCREYGAQIDGAAAVEKSCLLLEWLGRA